jgi:integrase
MARLKIEKNLFFDDVRKLFYVIFEYGKNEDGQRIRSSRTFKTKREAKEALDNFYADKTKGTLIMPTHDTIEDWLTHWLVNIKSDCSETTLYGYGIIIHNHMIPAIGKIAIQDLKPSMVYNYFSTLRKKGLVENTVKKHYVLLKDAMKHAVHEEKILKNPLDKVTPPKKVIKEMNYYKPEQLAELLAIVEGDRMEIVVLLAGKLGMRREEIAGLRWKYVDMEERLITVAEARTQAGNKIVDKDPKTTASRRTLHIPDSTFMVLKRIWEQQQIYREQLAVL